MKLKKPGKKNTQKIKSDITIPQIRWRKISDNRILMTNDIGRWVIFEESDFKKYLENRIPENSELYKILEEDQFIRTKLNFDEIYSTYQKLNSYLFRGPHLHILVLTLRCNHKCVYCQSQAIGEEGNKTDMNFATAKKAIDIAFQSTSPNITIEFQGGEPLLNWDVLKKSIEYARKKENNKKLFLSVVSNFSKMDEEKAEFFLKNEVSICTSLDGPEKLHNKNRIYNNGNSYEITLKWLRYFQERSKSGTYKIDGKAYKVFKPSALLTVTRETLKYPKEVVDEYIKNGIDSIFIRPLSPIGFARKVWDKIGYSAEEFLDFYQKTLDYIISKNKNGLIIKEKTAELLLRKIEKQEDPGFVDLRCPCGGGIGQLAYNYDGNIYTCDEGRMIAEDGNDLFLIGNIKDISYKDIFNSEAVKGCALSSNLESQHTCFRCVYRPYCGVCPVINCEAENSPVGNNIISQRCKIYMGILDIIFNKLDKNKKNLLNIIEE
jgi:His-Xaa-Ser system radical SAM maturase HxsB